MTTLEQVMNQRTINVINRDKVIFLLCALESCERIRSRVRDQRKDSKDQFEVIKLTTRLEHITAEVAQIKNEITKLKSGLPKTDFFKVDSKSEFKSGLTSRDFAGV